jgi:hypothetical protein
VQGRTPGGGAVQGQRRSLGGGAESGRRHCTGVESWWRCCAGVESRRRQRCVGAKIGGDGGRRKEEK